MIRSGTAACVGMILGAAACRQPPEVAFVTDRFEIAPEFDGELCGGNVAFMEARLAELTLDGKREIRPQFCATDPYNLEDIPNYFGRLGPGWHMVTVPAEFDAPRTVSAEFRPQ